MKNRLSLTGYLDSELELKMSKTWSTHGHKLVINKGSHAVMQTPESFHLLDKI
jgi:hypothetical protein